MKRYIITIPLLLCILATDLSPQVKAAIKDLAISKGSSRTVVVITWKSIPEKCDYLIYRSTEKTGNYIKIAEIKNNLHIDRDVDRGVKYFYRLYAVHNGIMSKPYMDYGYTSPRAPKGLTPDQILDVRNKDMPKPGSNEERQEWELHLRSMEKYYENIITISIIMFIGKIYVKKGTLIVFRDFDRYTIDYWKQTIHVYKDGMQPIKFYSKRLFRFLKNCKKNGIQEQDILPRLISNAIFFCIRRDDIELPQKDGKTQIFSDFEALGMSTEYFRDYKKWRSNTIVFGSDTKDLDELINKNRPKN